MIANDTNYAHLKAIFMKAISLAMKTMKIRDVLTAGLLLTAGLFAASAAWATTTINHQFSPATINPGDTSRYTITVANASTVSLTQADVTVIFPAQVTLANPPDVANTCGFTGVSAVAGTNTLVLTGGTIPARVGGTDGQCTFQADVTATAPGNHVASIPANTTPNGTTSGYTAFENGVQVWNTTLANDALISDRPHSDSDLVGMGTRTALDAAADAWISADAASARVMAMAV